MSLPPVEIKHFL